MAKLIPIPFGLLLKRIYHEHKRGNSIFDLPSKKFYQPKSDLDLSVTVCGNRAANPIGPAAGPQTQLAQNIVLSWLAGSRFIELKTVQINDRLELSRPCIDMATIGYNTEWSQELSLNQSLREYVKAHMLVEILKRWLFNDGSGLDTVFDTSVGYDLAGIQSRQIREWLNSMRNASAIIDDLRKEIPDEFKAYRDIPFRAEISNSITLSTFHGTPAGEIERICEFLMAGMGYHVIIKMNPPMLGKDRLEYLLYEILGYNNVTVNPKVYEVNMTFGDAVDSVRRLQAVAGRCGKTLGVKFGNTLEVINKGKFLKDNIQYLSGQPLHILHLALVEEWRKVFGAMFPISFSAGVDARNVVDCVAIGLAPVTVCTDLLRSGGYGRLPQYLINLERQMSSVGANTINELILRTSKSNSTTNHRDLHSAILRNTSDLLASSIENPRYRAAENQRPPRKIGQHLKLWDCINCDLCIPACPNDANFSFEVEPVEIQYNNVKIVDEGWSETEGGMFRIGEPHQIGTFADACNDCGNCDVYCPEDGGPYIEKPRFFGSLNAWQKGKKLSGFVLLREHGETVLYGRFANREYELRWNGASPWVSFLTAAGSVEVDRTSNRVVTARPIEGASDSEIDMSHYLVMATLLKSMTAGKRVHFVNAGIQ